MKSMFSDHMSLTAKVMDFRLQRQNIIASNLANINTKGYKAQRLEFEKQLQSELALEGSAEMTRTDKTHSPTTFDPNKSKAELVEEFAPRVIQGADTVNLDTEMGVMAKNSLAYKALTTVLMKNFEGLKNVIAEGAK